MENLVTLANGIRNREVSPQRMVRKLFKRIEEKNSTLQAYITLMEEQALDEAEKAENEIKLGNYRGPLHGIPIAVKDLIYTNGIRTTLGSKVFKDFDPEENATVVDFIKKAGGIIIGKLNTHELAYGSTGDRSYFGTARNPWNTEKMTGESSSGAGAALASGLCHGAIGTDTGGSIRIPSALCGVVGLKPTFGRVSKAGVYPVSFSLDHVGPITKTVEDNALLLGAIAGYDPKDPDSLYIPTEDFTRLLKHPVRGAVIGVPSPYFFETLYSDVSSTIKRAIKVFERLGAEIRTVNIPNIEDFWAWK